MKVNIYLENKPDVDGRCKLFFFLSGSGKRTKVYSGVKVKKEAWDGSQIRKGKYEPKGDLKNSIFQTKLSILQKIISEYSINLLDLHPDKLKELYLQKVTGNQVENTISGKYTIGQMVIDYKEKYKSIQAHNTLRNFDQVKTHLEQYRPGISIEEIDKSFLTGYCTYLVGLGLENSTIKDRHLKCIKSLAKEGIELKMNVSDEIHKFNWKSQPKIPFAATWKEVQEIMKLKDFINPKFEHIRDAFVISCHTGLRESDLNFSPQMITKQKGQWMLRVIMVKTGLDYQIPLSDEVYNTLKKYDFKVPSYSQQFYNESIKIIVRPVVKGIYHKQKVSGSNKQILEVDRYKMFSSHTGRRTFGRRFIDMGGSLIILSKIFGHKNTETTLKYIGYQPNEIINEFKMVFGMK